MTGNWGRWGKDDERGALNLVTPERLLKALSIPREGIVYQLAQMLQTSGVPMVTSRPAPIHTLTVDGGDYAVGGKLSNDAGSAEDHLFLHLHGSATHIDSLGHVWTGHEMYNGFDMLTIRSNGMRRLGIEKAGSIVTRGVLLDIAGSEGVAHLDADRSIGPAELERASARAGVTVGSGDAVLLRTGWSTVYPDDREKWERAWPGLGVDGARWLAERDIVLVGADQAAVEAVPFPSGKTAPVHQLLMRDHGIYLVELLDLERLAADSRREFLFLAAPLRLRGGTGSPLNPLAIV